LKSTLLLLADMARDNAEDGERVEVALSTGAGPSFSNLGFYA